jgi:hypothetical protein
MFNKTIYTLEPYGRENESCFLLFGDKKIQTCEIVGHIVSVDAWVNKITIMGTKEIKFNTASG